MVVTFRPTISNTMTRAIGDASGIDQLIVTVYVDNNNKITVSGERFKEIVDAYKSGNITPKKRTKAILLQSEENMGKYNPTIAWDAGHRYAECIRQGIYPAIILPEFEHDKEYLKSRGIEEIIK